MFGLGLPEIIVIALALGILLFGGKKITELSRSVGRASGEFKKGKQEVERELREEAEKNQSVPAANGSAEADGQAPATNQEEIKK